MVPHGGTNRLPFQVMPTDILTLLSPCDNPKYPAFSTQTTNQYELVKVQALPQSFRGDKVSAIIRPYLRAFPLSPIKASYLCTDFPRLPFRTNLEDASNGSTKFSTSS